MDVAVGIQKTIRMRSCWVGGWKGWRFAYAFVALPPISCMNLFHRHFQPVKSASCVSCGWGMLWWFTNWRDSQLLGNGSTDHGTTFFQTFGFGFFGSPPQKDDNQKCHNFQFGKRILPWCFVKLEYFCVVWFLWHVLAESRRFLFGWHFRSICSPCAISNSSSQRSQQQCHVDKYWQSMRLMLLQCTWI